MHVRLEQRCYSRLFSRWALAFIYLQLLGPNDCYRERMGILGLEGVKGQRERELES